MAQNNSKEINFQHYVDGVKEKKITWNFFTDLMEDLTYCDIERLRTLNAILLMELTMNYSDIDKMKYLNVILLIQFKNYVQTKHKSFKLTEHDYPETLQKSNVNQIWNEDTTIEKPIEGISVIEDVQMNENKSLEDSSVTFKDLIHLDRLHLHVRKVKVLESVQ